MDTDIAALRAAVDARQREVAQAERELAALRAELDAFAREYNARAGARQARLEALEAEIAELRRRPPGYRQVFAHGYASVEDQFKRAWTRPAEPDLSEKPAPAPPATGRDGELKRLYRALARAHHPDFAATDEDRARRTQAMAAINEAYAARRLDELRAAAGVPGAPREPELTAAGRAAWLRAELARAGDLLIALEHERRQLEDGPLMQLKVEAALGRRRGRDVLVEMVAWIDRRIAEREQELAMLRASNTPPEVQAP